MSKFLTTHWGTYEVVEGKNSKIALKPWTEDPSPTEFGLGLIEAAQDELRITQPYIRKTWL